MWPFHSIVLHNALRTSKLIAITVTLLVNSPNNAMAESDDAHHEHAHEHSHGRDHLPAEEIVITASPLEHSSDELATPVEVVDRDEVVEDLGATLGDTLRKVPGVSNSGFTGGSSRPVIRGQDAFRTEVLEGGLSTQDASKLSPDHAVPVNPLATQSVEVVRGPATLRYGGGASAGVVNALTNRIPISPTDRTATGEIIAIYGSNADEVDVATLLEGSARMPSELGEIGWHIDGFYRQSDDYENGSGDKELGTDTEAWSVSPGVAYFFDSGRFGLSFTRLENKYGIPEDEPVEIDMRTNRFRFEGDLDEPFSGISQISARGVYSEYTHDEIANGAIGQTYDNDEFDGRLEALHEPIFGFIGAIGFHGRTQDLVAGAEAEEFLAPSNTRTVAFYLFEERPLDNLLHAEFGLRAEGTWVDGIPISGDRRKRSFVPLSGSVGLVAHSKNDWTLGLTGVASQRAPSQVELYARGAHEATGTFEVGDPGLDEETSFTGELRLHGIVDPLDFELAAFTTYYHDFIFGQLTGIKVDEDGSPNPAGDLDQVFYRRRDAVFVGGEATAEADLFKIGDGVLGTAWQIDYVRARFRSGRGDKDVPRIPPLRWGASLYYKHDRYNGRFGFLRSERQWHSNDSEFATDDFTMLDLSLRYRLPILEDAMPVEIGLAARNLLDERARNAVSFNKADVLLPGRDIRVSLRARF